MRHPVDEALIQAFIRRFSPAAKQATRLYFTGGVCAVLKGWRSSTLDLDIRFDPEQDALFRAIPELKETLHVNIELAAPSDFLPALPGWQDRSEFITTEGKIAYYHYDFYSQALSKVEREHAQDTEDVERMLTDGLIEPSRVMELFVAIEDQLYRFPAVDPPTLRQRVEARFGETAE